MQTTWRESSTWPTVKEWNDQKALREIHDMKLFAPKLLIRTFRTTPTISIRQLHSIMQLSSAHVVTVATWPSSNKMVRCCGGCKVTTTVTAVSTGTTITTTTSVTTSNATVGISAANFHTGAAAAVVACCVGNAMVAGAGIGYWGCWRVIASMCAHHAHGTSTLPCWPGRAWNNKVV